MALLTKAAKTGAKVLKREARKEAEKAVKRGPAHASKPTEKVVPESVGGVKPEEVKTTPKTGRPEAITAVNLRRQSREEALATAKSERHIKPQAAGHKGEGAFVGAPYAMKSKEDLARIREQFDRLVSAGAGGSDWYERVQPWIKEFAGDDPAAQRELAQNLALMSSQANPDTNLGFSIRARNSNIMGTPEPIVRTGEQARKYQRSFESGEPIFDPTSDESKKTAIYGQHLDPTSTDPNTGTNDIWHARAFGYTTPEGDVWDAALSPQQHSWLDAETILATERANAMKLGGRDDWTPGQIQAAAWVAMKGQDLGNKAKKSLVKAEGKAAAAGKPTMSQADIAQRFAQLEEQGMSEATKTYPDYSPKYEFKGTHETVPGKTSGHLPEVAKGPQELRDEFSQVLGAGWMDPGTGRDIPYASQGAYTGRSVPMTGRFEGESNIGAAARPLVSFTGETGERVLDPSSQQLVKGTEAARGYFDVQDAGAGSIPIGSTKVGGQSGYSLGGIPFTPENMDWLTANTGLPDIVHYGGDQGLLANFNPDARNAALFGSQGQADLNAKLKERFGEGASAEGVGVGSTYTGYQDEWRGGAPEGQAPIQGSDMATNKMLAQLSPAQEASLSSPEMMNAVRLKYMRDEQMRGQGMTVRDDVQTARKIFSEEGMPGLRRALGRGILPAAGVGVFLEEFGLPQGGQQGGQL